MNLRQKILLLAMAPLVISVSAITLLVSYQAKSLSDDEIAFFEANMLAAKKSELLNYLSLAQTSIWHIYENAAADDEIAQIQVMAILNALTYGPDGYFFVYDFDGKSLVHPRQAHLIGGNWWDLRDPAGNLVIQALIEKARAGGDFYRYFWEKPSTGEIADKISYTIALEKWGWVVGTGMYIDDVIQQMEEAKGEVSDRIHETTIMILVMTLGSLAIVFSTGVAINLHEKRHADAKLKILTQRIIDTQEAERGRVARELHDGISQILVSVKYALELALQKAQENCQNAIESIEKSAEHLHLALKEIRRISRDLRPSALDDLGLSPAIQSLATEFSERTGIQVDVETVAFRNLLPGDLKTSLFRVAQEALTNIDRHAQASHIRIALGAPEGGVTLVIEDNGVGFDCEALARRSSPDAGIGLQNMRERLEHHNGSFQICSSAKGTKVIARLPRGVLEAP